MQNLVKLNIIKSLIENENVETISKILEYLNNEENRFMPKIFVTDFSIAAYNVIRNIYKDKIIIIFCFYHYTQSLL